MPVMKRTSAAVYGRRALSSLALAIAARSLWLRAFWDALCALAGDTAAPSVIPASSTAAVRETCGDLVMSVVAVGATERAPVAPAQRYILPPGCRVVSSGGRSEIVCGCSTPETGVRLRASS